MKRLVRTITMVLIVVTGLTGLPRAQAAAAYPAKTVIRRSEFGFNAMEHIISDEVEVIVAMETGPAD
jgi:hypothetical protein